MSHPQPPQRQPSDIETIKYAKALNTTAIVTAVACPVLALLPPRKLDAYTFSLVGASALSTNWLVKENTGGSIWQRVSNTNKPAIVNSPMATTSRPSQTSASRELEDTVYDYQRMQTNLHNSTAAELRSRRDEWKAQQQKEIQEEIEEGKGFGDMIMDQIWEVWHWRKKGRDNE